MPAKTDNNVLSLQPGQPGAGLGYDVHRPLPYPYFVDADTGDVTPGPQTGDESWRLIGFQPDEDTQLIVLTHATFVANPQQAVGLFPVFADKRGMFSTSIPIIRVNDWRTA